MPDPNGFLRYPRRVPARRPVPVRISDWREVYPPAGEELIREQATRCMDCGIPFCHSDTAGCPLGNRIPDWNDLVRTGNWDAAVESLHATNNFPEFTGRLCPAPCEAACVLGIAGGDPVTIKQVEVEIADAATARGLTPSPSATPSGRSVAVVGSGPAGLAAAQQLARAGHAVTVYERDDTPGGLLRYGIPDFKLEKRHVDARLAQLTAEGVVFRTGVNVGVDVTAAQLRAQHDAVLLACGALQGRDTDTPGRHLRGVHQAMAHLVAANRVVAAAGAGRPVLATLPDGTPIDAADKHVVIIGGGDTAADCLGVAHRQGAAGVHQLDLYPRPPQARDEERDPWPTWPWILREYAAHEEGGERVFAVAVQEFVDDGTGAVRAVRIAEVTVEKRDGRRILTPVPGTERELPADLVLLAIGFEGTEEQPLLTQFGVTRNARGAIDSRADWQTEADGVFVAGDMHRGASLIVWAIAEGRAAAAAIHGYLGGVGTLPAPVHAAAQPLAV
ncbi:glutamate synthase subunit beta [Micromonospora craniellae]|uniref:Glutamate synthase subunit beta n=1 Tax=Micromonospora craniellae TaxID=2294034 RepID=A0A372G2E9_9ACTN|nr:glutamate synthase subunit beta [Micromonospora craniellae]QOC91124.1 glutamate synthase subunit beta [Micromonospora craniellae]RFS47247.1 glutamate synthase subunit beta [Micromonospora craniellae]